MSYLKVQMDNRFLEKEPSEFGTTTYLIVNTTGNKVVAVVVEEQAALDIYNALNA